MSEEWDAKAALESLTSERDVFQATHASMAAQVFEQNVDAAAAMIVHTALHSSNEGLRLNAGKYVVERVMGKVGEITPTGVDPFEELLAACVRDTPAVPGGD